MYKAKNILKLTVLFLFIAIFTACVNDDDFDTPTVACDDSFLATIPASAMTSFQNALNTYTGSISDYADRDQDPIYLEGYVTSNDLKGTFYKELFIQDTPSNPNYALKLGIDVRSLYTKYPIGSKILIKLNGLSIDESHGEMTIGENINGEIDEMRENVSITQIFKSCTQETIVPIEVNSGSDLNNGMLGKYIQLNNTQFHVGSLGLTYVDPFDSFDSHKDIVFCSDNSILKLETSTFAAYGGLTLPSEKFTVKGVLTRDYGDDFYVLKMNSTDDITTTTDPRCDPLFVDSFNNLDNWTTYSVIGSQEWGITSFGNPGPSARVSGFSGGAQDNEDWLISNAIDLSTTVSPVLNFQTVKRYSGPDMETYMSTDYAGGNPTTDGTWTLLSATYDTNTGSWTSWTDSGAIDVSAANGGNLFIAFKYVSTTGGAATFEIDNVSIVEQ